MSEEREYPIDIRSVNEAIVYLHACKIEVGVKDNQYYVVYPNKPYEVVDEDGLISIAQKKLLDSYNGNLN